jgi:hypothetical protein
MPRRAASIVLGLALCAGQAAAEDPWELSGDGQDDDSLTTYNVLRHAVVQQRHDLEGGPPTPDQDWMLVVTKPRHSYEAYVTGDVWETAVCPTGAGTCPRFDRVSPSGTVLTPGFTSGDDVPFPSGSYSLGRTVRWIATTGGPEYLRAVGHQSLFEPVTPYDVVYYDTTLFVPRFNNTATQTTVLILQNTTSETVGGTAFFHDAAGVLLSSVFVSVPRNGVHVLATAPIPALAGRSGSVTIAQMGGYAALVGKAVALEPATGFTFDTPILHVPR